MPHNQWNKQITATWVCENFQNGLQMG